MTAPMALISRLVEPTSSPRRSGACAAARLLATIGVCLVAQATPFVPGPPAASAQEAVKSAAVLQFDAFSFAQVPAARMTDLFRTAVSETQTFGQIKTDAALDKPCLDLACAVAAAKQVHARFVVFGRISELDPDHWLISAALASAENSEMIRSAIIEQAGSPATLFPDAMKALANKLIGSRGASGERRVALFPILIMGGNPSFPSEVMNVYLAAVKTLQPYVPTVSIAYVFDEPVMKALGSGSSKSHNIISLRDDRAISSDSWEGILNPTPNLEFILKKCQDLDVDNVLFAKFFPWSGTIQHFRFAQVDCNLRTMNEKEGPFLLEQKVVYSSRRSNVQSLTRYVQEEAPLRAAMVELLKQ